MKVAVIGTVGVPANYGGFETLAENLLTYKKDKSIEYRIFCSSKHYNKKLSTYKGAILTYVPLEASILYLHVPQCLDCQLRIRRHVSRQDDVSSQVVDVLSLLPLPGQYQYHLYLL